MSFILIFLNVKLIFIISVNYIAYIDGGSVDLMIGLHFHQKPTRRLRWIGVHLIKSRDQMLECFQRIYFEQ